MDGKRQALFSFHRQDMVPMQFTCRVVFDTYDMGRRNAPFRHDVSGGR